MSHVSATSSDLLEKMQADAESSKMMLDSLKREAEPIDMNDPLFKAFRGLNEVDKFRILRSALIASHKEQYGGLVYHLLGDGKLSMSDLIGLKSGTHKVRCVGVPDANAFLDSENRDESLYLLSTKTALVQRAKKTVETYARALAVFPKDHPSYPKIQQYHDEAVKSYEDQVKSNDEWHEMAKSWGHVA